MFRGINGHTTRDATAETEITTDQSPPFMNKTGRLKYFKRLHVAHIIGIVTCKKFMTNR